MGAAPNKALLTVAQRALALLDPDWPIAADLRAALESAQAVKAAPKRKSFKNQPGTPYPQEIESLHRSFQAMARINYVVTNAIRPGMGGENICDTQFGTSNGRKDAILASFGDLSTCACGHGSGAHKADALENLLACEASGCHCDHFHYGADSAQREAA